MFLRIFGRLSFLFSSFSCICDGKSCLSVKNRFWRAKGMQCTYFLVKIHNNSVHELSDPIHLLIILFFFSNFRLKYSNLFCLEQWFIPKLSHFIDFLQPEIWLAPPKIDIILPFFCLFQGINWKQILSKLSLEWKWKEGFLCFGDFPISLIPKHQNIFC